MGGRGDDDTGRCGDDDVGGRGDDDVGGRGDDDTGGHGDDDVGRCSDDDMSGRGDDDMGGRGDGEVSGHGDDDVSGRGDDTGRRGDGDDAIIVAAAAEDLLVLRIFFAGGSVAAVSGSLAALAVLPRFAGAGSSILFLSSSLLFPLFSSLVKSPFFFLVWDWPGNSQPTRSGLRQVPPDGKDTSRPMMKPGFGLAANEKNSSKLNLLPFSKGY